MRTNVCIDNRSILLLFCLKKFQCLSSFLLQALLFVIAQGNSDLIDCEAFHTGFWKKKSQDGEMIRNTHGVESCC